MKSLKELLRDSGDFFDLETEDHFHEALDSLPDVIDIFDLDFRTWRTTILE